MEILHDKNLYVQTHIKGNDLEEIKEYCRLNRLTITDMSERGSLSRNRYSVWANKPNCRARVLRKRVEEWDGWKIIKTEPTPKMFWVTYEKVPQDT